MSSSNNDFFFTLEGVWELSRGNSEDVDPQVSHEDLYRDLYAAHFSAEETESLSLEIAASNLDTESISFTYSSAHGAATRFLLVNNFNILYPSCSTLGGSSSSCNSEIFGSVISLESSDGTCSVLLIGPQPGQRIIEKYSLEDGGEDLKVRYFISSIEGDFQVVRKYKRKPFDRTSTETQKMPAMLQFAKNHSANNWKRVKSHCASTLQALQISVSIENNLQALVDHNSLGDAPDSAYPSANAVIMYKIELQLPPKDNMPLRSWHVTYRYSHFRSVRDFLCAELADIRQSTAKHLPDMPNFPPKWPFVKSESSLQYRCQGLQHFICSLASQGAYEPFVGPRAVNMVDLLSAFLEVPNHFAEVSDCKDTSTNSPSINSHHYCHSVYHTIHTDVRSDSSSEEPLPSPDKSKQPIATAPIFVVVKGARNRRAPMFPHVSLFEWVPIVEYELFITRVEDNASMTVFRRYKDISSWFQNILDILSVTHSADTLKKLNLPAKKSSRHINTFSASSKTDVTGNFVKFRIDELQKSIQSLLTQFPVVVNLPLSQEFFELHRFAPVTDNDNSTPECP